MKGTPCPLPIELCPAIATAGRHQRVWVPTSRRPHPHLLESGLARSPSLTHHPWCQRQCPSLRWIRDKAEGAGRRTDKSVPPMRWSESFRRRCPAISRFMARFARRQQGTGRTNCRLADVLSSAAHARLGGVHGQQCDISGDFVAGSIWLLLQQRWLTEQTLGERNYETRW